MTENLAESLAKDQGLISISGGEYASNNLSEHVDRTSDGSGGVSLLDSKQMTDGAFKILKNASCGNLQMSDK